MAASSIIAAAGGGRAGAAGARRAAAVVTDPLFVEHWLEEGHPESPARYRAVIAGLEQGGLLAKTAALAPATDVDPAVLAVHTQEHLRQIRGLYGRSHEVALRAVGAGIAGVRAVCDGGAGRVRERAGGGHGDADYGALGGPHERALVMAIGSFGPALRGAASSLSPKTLARYAHGLAVGFNSFYEHVRVTDGEGGDGATAARVALVAAFRATIEGTAGSLGIPMPGRM